MLHVPYVRNIYRWIVVSLQCQNLLNNNELMSYAGFVMDIFQVFLWQLVEANEGAIILVLNTTGRKEDEEKEEKQSDGTVQGFFPMSL